MASSKTLTSAFFQYGSRSQIFFEIKDQGQYLGQGQNPSQDQKLGRCQSKSDVNVKM